MGRKDLSALNQFLNSYFLGFLNEIFGQFIDQFVRVLEVYNNYRRPKLSSKN